jgi:hypothetical protein
LVDIGFIRILIDLKSEEDKKKNVSLHIFHKYLRRGMGKYVKSKKV